MYKDDQSFRSKIIIIYADSLYSNTPEEMKCPWVS